MKAQIISRIINKGTYAWACRMSQRWNDVFYTWITWQIAQHTHTHTRMHFWGHFGAILEPFEDTKCAFCYLCRSFSARSTLTSVVELCQVARRTRLEKTPGAESFNSFLRSSTVSGALITYEIQRGEGRTIRKSFHQMELSEVGWKQKAAHFI